jgi:hypothetical protein
MRYPEEPHTLIGGTPIHLGAVDLLDALLMSGHRVTVAADGGAVNVDPCHDLHPNHRWALEAFAEDLLILLSLGATTVH